MQAILDGGKSRAEKRMQAHFCQASWRPESAAGVDVQKV